MPIPATMAALWLPIAGPEPPKAEGPGPARAMPEVQRALALSTSRRSPAGAEEEEEMHGLESDPTQATPEDAALSSSSSSPSSRSSRSTRALASRESLDPSARDQE